MGDVADDLYNEASLQGMYEEEGETNEFGEAKRFREDWQKANPKTIHIPSEHELKLMTDFSNQQNKDNAIGFAEWVGRNEWIYHALKDYWIEEVDEVGNKTSDELYQMYLDYLNS